MKGSGVKPNLGISDNHSKIGKLDRNVCKVTKKKFKKLNIFQNFLHKTFEFFEVFGS